jgi:Solitary outer membrane autotransporter beta-barrel domain
MFIKKLHRLSPTIPGVGIAAGCAVWLLMTIPVAAQLSEFKNTVGSRVEATTILGGDYGLSGGAFTSVNNNDGNVDINITKFGGMGDIYPIRPLGELGIGWQPQLQGSMGYFTGTKHYNENSILNGDQNENKTFAIQFGGGARFWFSDSFSIAPTVMGMYGHTENDYTANSDATRALVPSAEKLGLINWNVDTWTVRPALDLQYQYTWHRTIFTLSSDLTYYYTESFNSSSSDVDVNGNSESWISKLDVDVPLGVELFGHELRTGGFYSRTQLYDGLREGLNTDYVNEAHGRLVLDFLDQLWKVQYIGVGVSYLWSDNFNGWSIGADVAFRF